MSLDTFVDYQQCAGDCSATLLTPRARQRGVCDECFRDTDQDFGGDE